ncbi:unnamed protein product [Adineta ricciae]|uniref:Fibronectin type-III domain-containing protein n=1 Tax=Adineta ricciae TaxID=249248 RepID=A0A814YQ36_ADIRI|nr:unnamed protein product [Adineta ricciae]
MYLLSSLCIIIYGIDVIDPADVITFSATLFNTSTITNDSVTLNVELSNCTIPCSCHVQTNKTGNFEPVKFHSTTSKGYVTINNLQTYTMYSFDLNCSEVIYIKTYTIRTDVSRPSPPNQIQIILIKQRLRLTWAPPNLPNGPIDTYRITVDGKEKKPYLANTELFYDLNENYIFGVTHTMSVRACNTDSQKRALCSNAGDAESSFVENKTDLDTTVATIDSKSVRSMPFVLMYFIQSVIFTF